MGRSSMETKPRRKNKKGDQEEQSEIPAPRRGLSRKAKEKDIIYFEEEDLIPAQHKSQQKQENLAGNRLHESTDGDASKLVGTTKRGRPPKVKGANCTECGKRFTFASDLYKHLQLHRGEEQFPCSECEKSFNQSSHLVLHQKLHTGEKLHSCDQSTERDASKSTDTTTRKQPSKGKAATCTECGKRFTFATNLHRHMLLHRGEKPFQCSECEKKFNQSTHLVLHQRLHTGEKPFACSECKMCFSDPSNLASHERTHTGVKPYACSDCGKSFRHSSDLMKHQPIHTDTKPRRKNKKRDQEEHSEIPAPRQGLSKKAQEEDIHYFEEEDMILEQHKSQQKQENLAGNRLDESTDRDASKSVGTTKLGRPPKRERSNLYCMWEEIQICTNTCNFTEERNTFSIVNSKRFSTSPHT